MAMNGNGHRKSARVVIYRHYRFIDKDPVIPRMKTMMDDEGLNEHKSAQVSGLAPATLANWFRGDTKRPQFSSIKAFSRSLGYELTFEKIRKGALDVDAEIKATIAFKNAKRSKADWEKIREFRWE